MDILTDVLSTLHLRNVCYGPMELHAPWGVHRGSDTGKSAYLIVTEGRCLLDVETAESHELAPGDVIFLMSNHRYTLRDGSGTAALSLEEFRKSRRVDDRGIEHYGSDGGARTVMVWGGFEFEQGNLNPLFSTLPAVIHIKATYANARWVESCVGYLTEEVGAKAPGYELIANRLIDVLFVQAVREMIADADTRGMRGWGCSLMDPQISRALSAIHAEPGRDWTIESLAREAGMSRSGFAARFTDCVGQAPGAYLTSWRLQKAADTLRSTRTTLSDISARSGYSSETSFVRAFKRQYGTTPQAYRKGASSRVTP